MTQKVNISRSVWGQIGGMVKIYTSIKLTLISGSFFIWGQDWGQDFATDAAWGWYFDTKSYFYFIINNKWRKKKCKRKKLKQVNF